MLKDILCKIPPSQDLQLNALFDNQAYGRLLMIITMFNIVNGPMLESLNKALKSSLYSQDLARRRQKHPECSS
jgi:hypothetical protein